MTHDATKIGSTWEPQPSGRLVGVDLARLIAIFGMMAAHLISPYLDGGWIVAVSSGFPAALFAVLGGFGSYFAARSFLLAGNKAAALVSLVVRGGVVAVIGLALEVLPDHRIAVVLIYYGVAIMVSAPLVLLPWQGVAAVVGVLLVANPFVLFTLRSVDAGVRIGFIEFSSARAFLLSVFFTGAYPVLTWVTYIGMGLLLARPLVGAASLGRERVVALKGGATGLVVATIAYVAGKIRLPGATDLLVSQYGVSEAEAHHHLTAGRHGGPLLGGVDSLLALNPHSGSAVNVLLTGGVALALTAALVLATFRQSPPSGSLPESSTPFWLALLAKAGATPLTIYVGHIALTAYAYHWASVRYGTQFAVPGPNDPWWISYGFWVQAVVALFFALALLIGKRRGPLETLTSWLSKSAARPFEKG